MKRITILTICAVIAAVLFASCSNDHNGNNVNINDDIEQAGRSDNSTLTNKSAADTLVSKDEKNGEIMFGNILPVSVSGSDRMPRSASSILSYPEKDANEETCLAICVVTVLDIDTPDRYSDLGKRVPISLRIDSIIGKNPAFTLNVDASVLVTDYSYWRKERDGFSVNYMDGTIPITERNTQYIVLMHGIDEETKKSLQDDIDYLVEALTIPITETENVSYDDIYSYLNLPDDVIKCSDDLINRFVNKTGKSTSSAVLQAPSDSCVYSFNSYNDLSRALYAYDRFTTADLDNYGELFAKTVRSFNDKTVRLYVPCVNKDALRLRNKEGFSSISLMTAELYNLPWIWYHCEYNGADVEIKLAYTSVIESRELASAKTYREILSIIAPDAPNPDNFTEFESYKNVYEKKLTLADGKIVDAMILEMKDSDKIYVMFSFDGMLISVFAEDQILTDQFWSGFSLLINE